ncbi:hypothetical protein EGW08_013382 [Elysia chlorotica]|uniref:Uncharacterized protein n=1 Tax=Elysia chlorotica TaxID=188477 RepID=A0A433TBF3_ELYCH|nr:hypothetical protein EGW08_013382 [Elysia chlorotica]
MVDLRQRAQGSQGPAVAPPAANLDDSRYREAAAAYAMMGIAGYTDPRVVGSRPHGQSYLGMYPWYNETALTQAMMESRQPLPGMMGNLGNLGYAGGPSFVDPRLREQHGRSSGVARDDQQYARGLEDMDAGQGYARDSAAQAYSQEMMTALARHRDYEGGMGGHQRYHTQGDLDQLEQQYKAHRDASRESRFGPGTQTHHGMMRAGLQDDVGISGRDERGYGALSSSSHGQGGSIHRSWM